MAATASTGPSSKQTVRIQRDLKALEKDPLPFVRDLQASVENGVNQVSGILTGPEGSNYAGNEYRFLMIFPAQYPFRVPEFYFTSTISHPNVDEKTGTTCNAQLFSEWAPNVTLSHVFTQMHQLLANPNYDTPLEAGS